MSVRVQLLDEPEINIGDIVLVPPRYKIQATVQQILDNVAMVCPWNCGHERMFRIETLKHTGEKHEVRKYYDDKDF